MTRFQYLLNNQITINNLVKLGFMCPSTLVKIDIYSKINALKHQGVKQSEAIRRVRAKEGYCLQYYHKLITYMETKL